MSLTTLPTELVREICAYLPPISLVHLLQTTRIHRSAIQELLYTNVSIFWPSLPNQHDSAGPPTIIWEPRLQHLLRTLIACPNLAHHIKSVSLQGYMPKTIWREETIPELSPACLKAYADVIGSHWSQQLQEGIPEAFVAVLLRLCKRLKSLEIGCLGYTSDRQGAWRDRIPEPEIVDPLAETIPRLQTLEYVACGADTQDEPYLPLSTLR